MRVRDRTLPECWAFHGCLINSEVIGVLTLLKLAKSLECRLSDFFLRHRVFRRQVQPVFGDNADRVLRLRLVVERIVGLRQR